MLAGVLLVARSVIYCSKSRRPVGGRYWSRVKKYANRIWRTSSGRKKAIKSRPRLRFRGVECLTSYAASRSAWKRRKAPTDADALSSSRIAGISSSVMGFQ